MSNIFLANAFLFYANEAAGCLDDNSETIEDCEGRTHGFRPGSLISNIAVIAGLLTAFLMPWIGAVIDYTKYRRLTGIAIAVLLTIIQAVQIGTVSQTWFVMLILQGIAGFLYEAEIMTLFAYLPEMAREAGEDKMRGFSSKFSATQFTAQASFLLLVVVLSIVFGFSSNDALVAKVSQGINVVWIGIFFIWGWCILPSRPKNHELPKGRSLTVQGFVQVWDTTKQIFLRYKVGLRWFLLSNIFAEATVNAFTTVSVIFLNEEIKLSGADIGIFFLVTMIGAASIGPAVAAFVSNRTNPNISIKLCMLAMIVIACTGALTLEARGSKILTFLWGFALGSAVGWFYPTENLFFALASPKGQEAELAGFFVYCNTVLSWFPPLTFNPLVLSNSGAVAVSCLLFISIAILCLTGKWEEVLADAKHSPGERVDPNIEKERDPEGPIQAIGDEMA